MLEILSHRIAMFNVLASVLACIIYSMHILIAAIIQGSHFNKSTGYRHHQRPYQSRDSSCDAVCPF